MPISRFPAAILAVFIGWWLFGSSAHATDLTGAWANDASVCKNVFVKKDGKITFTDDSNVSFPKILSVLDSHDKTESSHP